MITWNPWHGCVKYSEGCRNCYVYELDAARGINASIIRKLKSSYDLPLHKDRQHNYKIRPGSVVWVCMTSDLFLPEADEWRGDIWDIIRLRPDVLFVLLTKRITRVAGHLPDDWGFGWENVMLFATIESKEYIEERMTALMAVPAMHKGLMLAPFLSDMDLSPYLSGSGIEEILCGGENYAGCRECHYEWAEHVQQQAKDADITFNFTEIGTNFIKNGAQIWCPDRQSQSEIARILGLSYAGKHIDIRLHMPDGTPVNFLQDRYFRAGVCDRCSRQLTCTGCTKCRHCKKRNC